MSAFVKLHYEEVIDEDVHRVCYDLGEPEPRWVPRSVIFDQDEAENMVMIGSDFAKQHELA